MKQTNKKVALVTLGCPKNQVDSEVLAGELARGGMTFVSNVNEADVIFVNTCSFIEEAKKESIKAILEAVELKKNGKERNVYVWGCLSERYRGNIEREIPEVDNYFGVEPYEEIGRFLLGSSYQWNEEALNNRIISTPSHTAYLKIADGCDHKCTFCAIPMIKGKFRSRSETSLVEEAHILADNGVKELIIVAQDTTAYGLDLEDGICLVNLLKRFISIAGIQWIRIMYTHPAYITDDLIDLIASEKKICKYIDLPIQHISDKILSKMGRGTPRSSIENLIQKLRNRISGLVLRTAFIVGFPGETDETFKELLDFIRETRFERMGAFVFSPEEGTEAFNLGSNVPKEVAQMRYQILMETQQEISRKINLSMESRILPVIVDGYNKEQELFWGRSEGDALEIDQTVWIKGRASVGEIIQVLIKESSAYDLMGSTLK